MLTVLFVHLGEKEWENRREGGNKKKIDEEKETRHKQIERKNVPGLRCGGGEEARLPVLFMDCCVAVREGP